MNKEEPIRDQAEKLRKRMKNVDLKIDTIENETISHPNEKLPPRSRVHKQKQMKKKTKIKVKYPLIRLLGMFFILLPIVIFSIYTYNESQKTSGSTPIEESKGAEAIYYTDEEEEVEETKSTEEAPIDQTVGKEDQETDLVEESAASEQTNTTEETQETTTASETTTNVEPKAEPVDQTVIYHKVQPGETVYRIAMKYYKSQSGIDIIKKANSLSSNEITVGQTLTIPLSK